jgi:hypothetical protein
MIENFDTTELVVIFRSGLLSLLPVMAAARIRWTEPGVYDPWENIERTLYSSIIGSCVENAVPGGLRPLATYGLTYRDYSASSFLSERALLSEGTMNALVELQTEKGPFDVAVLRELNVNFIPTGRAIVKPLGLCTFDLGARDITGIEYRSCIAYQS